MPLPLLATFLVFFPPRTPATRLTSTTVIFLVSIKQHVHSKVESIG
jgi:hypothetical protein